MSLAPLAITSSLPNKRTFMKRAVIYVAFQISQLFPRFLTRHMAVFAVVQ